MWQLLKFVDDLIPKFDVYVHNSENYHATIQGVAFNQVNTVCCVGSFIYTSTAVWSPV